MTKEIKYSGDCELSKLYKGLPDNLTTFLRNKESNMREIVGKAYTELGRELSETRDRLAGSNQYDGVFERWFTAIGFKKANVYRLIDRYDLVVSNWNEQNLIEDLPVSLTYDIAKPSAESTPAKAQAKAEVLAGEIASRKAYKERIKELEEKARQAEQSAELERKERERLERENEELAEKADKPPKVEYETRTEYIEVDNTPGDYDEVKRRLDEYYDKFGDLSNYDDNVTATHVQDMISATMSFKRAVKDVAKRFAYMNNYKDAINRMDHVSKQEYNETVKALHEFADSFDYLEDSDRVIINQ